MSILIAQICRFLRVVVCALSRKVSSVKYCTKKFYSILSGDQTCRKIIFWLKAGGELRRKRKNTFCVTKHFDHSHVCVCRPKTVINVSWVCEIAEWSLDMARSENLVSNEYKHVEMFVNASNWSC
jgi:hypothetical protein